MFKQTIRNKKKEKTCDLWFTKNGSNINVVAKKTKPSENNMNVA